MGTDEFGHEVGDPQFLPWRTSLEVIYRVFHLDWEKALSFYSQLLHLTISIMFLKIIVIFFSGTHNFLQINPKSMKIPIDNKIFSDFKINMF